MLLSICVEAELSEERAEDVTTTTSQLRRWGRVDGTGTRPGESGREGLYNLGGLDSGCVEAINTACYVQNQVLVNKQQMQTPYEILYNHRPTVSHFRTFGCPCTLLHLEATLKFNSKADDCYFVGYAGQENDTDARVGPDWLFDYAELFKPFYAFLDNVSGTPSSSSFNLDEDEEVPADPIRPSMTLIDVGPPQSDAQPTDATPLETFVIDVSCTDSPQADTAESPVIEVSVLTSTSYGHANGNAENITNLPVSSGVLDYSLLTRIKNNHPIDNVIGSLTDGEQTRSQTGHVNEYLYSCFISQIEPKNVDMALTEPSWVDAMHEELNQFEKLRFWQLVELPKGKKSLDTCWIFRNKLDDSGVIVRNKARLVVRGFRQIEGLDYTKVYALVARLEDIRIFLAYASYMGFTVYQMDVKTAFLYGEVKEEIYVDQPPDFVNSDLPTHVYKLDKELYGFHQAPRAWCVLQGPLFPIDDIIFGSTSETSCKDFEAVMKKRFEMSSLGEMTMFLGLQVKQVSNGILLHQGKYVTDMLKKFGFQDSREASTPMAERPLLNSDPDGSPVDQTSYLSMIRSLMYLTASRPDIVFSVCQYLKGRPKLGLWYPKNSAFDLYAFIDSNYGGCELGDRLISWQCKKLQTVSTSTAEAEYVAASTCSSQHIDIKVHFIRDCFECGLIHLDQVHTDNNVADLFTKPFRKTRFDVLVGFLKMIRFED
ncbi:hypothetical protein LXL04_016030 [Taraxacum kok-saghyz]